MEKMELKNSYKCGPRCKCKDKRHCSRTYFHMQICGNAEEFKEK